MQTPLLARNAHAFQFFNAISFQIILGAPIILYAKSLGASSTVLGIIAAFTPLLMVFQLPAAQFLERVGYKQFILMGWALRTIFIFVVALVPFLHFLDNPSKIVVILAALFFFNLLRGISTAAWMPWITGLVSPGEQGRFVSANMVAANIGCLIALLASALVMTGKVDNWEYALVFALSGIGATISLVFLRRMPDIPPGETTRRSGQSVPWRAIVKYPPFRILLIFTVVFMVVLGGMGIFTVEYLREIPKFNPDTILVLSTMSFVGALISLPIGGRLTDLMGSRPVLFLSTLLFGVSILGWFLLAAGVGPVNLWTVGTLNFLIGVATANFQTAHTRLLMQTAPEMGRNHFFAIFAVISSLGLGASPILWGVSLDAIGTFELVTGWFHWRKHSIYFLAIFLVNIVALFLVSKLIEPTGPPPEEKGFLYGAVRRLSRLWHV